MALTTIPAAGAKLRGSVLSSLITEVRPIQVVKSADETVNNTTTLQNDDELVLSVEASCTYELRGRLQFNSNSTADFKFGWTYPTGTTMDYTGTGFNVSGSFVSATLVETTEPGYGGGALSGGTDDTVMLYGVVVTSTTAGSLQLKFAQNTANVSNTTLRATSSITLRRLA